MQYNGRKRRAQGDSCWKIFIMQIDFFLLTRLLFLCLHTNRSPLKEEKNRLHFNFFISTSANRNWTKKKSRAEHEPLNMMQTHIPVRGERAKKELFKLPTFATSSRVQQAPRRHFQCENNLFSNDNRRNDVGETETRRQAIVSKKEKRVPWKFRIIIGVKLIIKRANLSFFFSPFYVKLYEVQSKSSSCTRASFMVPKKNRQRIKRTTSTWMGIFKMFAATPAREHKKSERI